MAIATSTWKHTHRVHRAKLDARNAPMIADLREEWEAMRSLAPGTVVKIRDGNDDNFGTVKAHDGDCYILYGYDKLYSRNDLIPIGVRAGRKSEPIKTRATYDGTCWAITTFSERWRAMVARKKCCDGRPDYVAIASRSWPRSTRVELKAAA